MKRILLPAAGAVFTAYSVATAFYGLLAYLPFTYHQVLYAGLLPWLNTSARWHPWLNLGAVALVMALLISPLRRPGWLRRAALLLAACEVAGAVALLVHPILPGLHSDRRSLAWSLVALAPPLWLAAIHIAAGAGRLEWGERQQGWGPAHFAAAWRSAIFVSLLYGCISLVRSVVRLSPVEAAPVLAWSMLAHLLIFLALFLVLDWMMRLAGLFRTPAKVEFWLYHALLAGAVAAVMLVVVCPSLGFTGWPSLLFSGLLGLVLASQNAAYALAMASRGTTSDGIGLAVSATTLGLVRSIRGGAAALVVLALAGSWMAVKAAAMDWSFTMQELSAALIWMASFACFYASLSRRSRTGGLAWVALPLALVGLYRGLEAAPPPELVMERWAGSDASYRLARVLLTPNSGHGSFYQFLGRNTNIAASVHVDPVPVQLTDSLQRSPGPLPNIFIVTFDSLRRDYLAPYNPAVTFTPAIDNFVRESTVFRNAFTRYGGTGLSEPAIWSGAMLLHKQYVTPFGPMNALERLLGMEQYQMLLSRDSILTAILTPSPAAVELDPPEASRSYDLARSLERMEEEIDRRAADPRPIFGYTRHRTFISP
jgi:hypothetical protein